MPSLINHEEWLPHLLTDMHSIVLQPHKSLASFAVRTCIIFAPLCRLSTICMSPIIVRTLPACLRIFCSMDTQVKWLYACCRWKSTTSISQHPTCM